MCHYTCSEMITHGNKQNSVKNRKLKHKRDQSLPINYSVHKLRLVKKWIHRLNSQVSQVQNKSCQQEFNENFTANSKLAFSVNKRYSIEYSTGARLAESKYKSCYNNLNSSSWQVTVGAIYCRCSIWQHVTCQSLAQDCTPDLHKGSRR